MAVGRDDAVGRGVGALRQVGLQRHSRGPSPYRGVKPPRRCRHARAALVHPDCAEVALDRFAVAELDLTRLLLDGLPDNGVVPSTTACARAVAGSRIGDQRPPRAVPRQPAAHQSSLGGLRAAGSGREGPRLRRKQVCAPPRSRSARRPSDDRASRRSGSTRRAPTQRPERRDRILPTPSAPPSRRSWSLLSSFTCGGVPCPSNGCGGRTTGTYRLSTPASTLGWHSSSPRRDGGKPYRSSFTYLEGARVVLLHDTVGRKRRYGSSS